MKAKLKAVDQIMIANTRSSAAAATAAAAAAARAAQAPSTRDSTFQLAPPHLAVAQGHPLLHFSA